MKKTTVTANKKAEVLKGLIERRDLIEMKKINLKTRLLAGEEMEILDYSLVREVYYELIEEIKDKAMDLFRDVATTHYMDTRCELNELESIMMDFIDYKTFYNELMDDETKLDLEEQIMEELAEELKDDSNYVIGYNWGAPVMIMCMEHFIDEIKDYKDEEEYENIGFYRNNIEIK